MKGKIISNYTPQQKAVSVNNRFGNTNIKNQQGTTRVLYDTLPIDGRTEFRFFENANTRTYPLTNLTSDGNKLSVGETFIFQDLYFQYFDYNGTFQYESSWRFDGSVFGGGPGEFVFAGAMTTNGEIDFYIANSQVVKGLPTIVCDQTFNPTSSNTVDNVFNMSTDIVIPPLLEYVLVLRTTSLPTPANANYIRCSIRGTAGIIAPQTTF